MKKFTAKHHERLRVLADMDEEDLTEAQYRELQDLNEAWEREQLEARFNPACCDAMRRTRAIVYDVDIYHDEPSSWRLRLAPAHSLNTAKVPSPTFCPFCGSRVPHVVSKSEPPTPLMVCTDGGYYCDTCEKRLIACLCWHPEAAFEVGTEPTIRTGPTGH